MRHTSIEERGTSTVNDTSPIIPPRRATTDEEKRVVLERLYVLWCAHPELRLGQLLANVSSDLYYTEDFPLIEMLEHFYAVPTSKR